jgi:hypothetical protein
LVSEPQDVVAVAYGESAARAAVVCATSAEDTEAWHGAAAWRIRRLWRSGRGMAFVAKAYVAAVLEFVLEFVYIFQAYVAEELGVCR